MGKIARRQLNWFFQHNGIKMEQIWAQRQQSREKKLHDLNKMEIIFEPTKWKKIEHNGNKIVGANSQINYQSFCCSEPLHCSQWCTLEFDDLSVDLLNWQC